MAFAVEPPGTARPSIRTEWPAIAGLAACFVAVAVIIGAWRDVPVIDDWTYAWSVEQLLNHGRLAVLDWSSVYPVGPAIWGAAWSAVFGFSFGTLRASTLALALAAAVALYLTLRELQAPRRVAFFGAITVATSPAVLLLSSSFMTDVPFVACTLIALLHYVRALHRDDRTALWWAGLFGALSVLSRQVGVLAPVAALPLLLRPSGRITRGYAAGAMLLTWLVMGAELAMMSAWLQPTSEMTKLVDRFAWLFTLPVQKYVTFNLLVFSTMALYALPALLAMAGRRGVWRSRTLAVAGVVTTAVLLTVIGEIPNPLQPGSTWTLHEVGGARQLLSGAFPPADQRGVELLLRAVGLVAMTLAVVAMSVSGVSRAGDAGLRVGLRDRVQALVAWLTTPRGPLVVYFIGYAAMANVLWFYNDRYVLAMLPVGVMLALGHRATTTRLPAVAWVAAVVLAAVGLVGTRDTLRVNQQVRDSWQALVDAGVPPGDIDAGYAWTGWALYAHPENLGAGRSAARDVPWITSRAKLPYQIAKGKLEGYDVAREVTWGSDAAWPGPDRLYVLKKRPPQADATTPAARPSS